MNAFLIYDAAVVTNLSIATLPKQRLLSQHTDCKSDYYKPHKVSRLILIEFDTLDGDD